MSRRARPAPPRVLVVEDSDAVQEVVAEALTSAGYLTEVRSDGTGLEDALAAFRPDVVVLDVMMPGREGFALIDVIRDHDDTGVILLTTTGEPEDGVRGLNAGVDDYLEKPFEQAELLSRVGAALRRRGRASSTVQLGDLVIEAREGTASRAGHRLRLTVTEFRLLLYLAEQRGRIVSTEQILAAVWRYNAYDPNLVQVYVSALRRKLEAHGPRILRTVRGVGYQLQPISETHQL